MNGRRDASGGAGWAGAAAALSRGDRLRVVFVNDCGFIGGAGVGQRRQALSFLHAGHEVGVVCCLDSPASPVPRVLGAPDPGGWLGLRSMPELDVRNRGAEPGEVRRRVAEAVSELGPDLVIVGNLHWTAWPEGLIDDLARAGVAVCVYLHDCNHFTGRCVYTGGCEKFRGGGCDGSCPTPEQYPALPPAEIAPAQGLRLRVFGGERPRVPVAANSVFMAGCAQAAFGPRALVRCVPLGLDDLLFSPIDRRLARRLLGLPEDGLIVLVGAVDIADERKGGPLIHAFAGSMSKRPGVTVLGFGHNSEYVRGVHGLGHIADERVMPVVYAASDVKVTLAKEEAFGQTSLEASACGVPVVAHRTGGLPEIARDDENAVLVDEYSVEAFVEACDVLLADEPLRLRLGAAGRELAVRRHGVTEQMRGWAGFIREAARFVEAGSADASVSGEGSSALHAFVPRGAADGEGA